MEIRVPTHRKIRVKELTSGMKSHTSHHNATAEDRNNLQPDTAECDNGVKASSRGRRYRALAPECPPSPLPLPLPLPAAGLPVAQRLAEDARRSAQHSPKPQPSSHSSALWPSHDTPFGSNIFLHFCLSYNTFLPLIC